MANRTKGFNQQRSYLSSDYVNADVQGLTNDFYEWINTNIRLSDVTSLSATSTKKTDDYKLILFPDLQIDYFPIGAKIQTMGNTWIAINPANMSSVDAKCIIARCNASYNSYDYYGNIIAEPIIVEKNVMLGNDNETPNNLVLMDGYFNITCQLNENTSRLKENSRIILGDKPYHITGLTDFIQEFSKNRNSCHLLTFTARVEEPQINDDLKNTFIADGKLYGFQINIEGNNELNVGETSQLIPYFIKRYDSDITEVMSTDDYPLTYIWTSSDTNIATVGETGNVFANTTGDVKITAKLKQNPNIYSDFELFINEVKTQPYVAFLGVIPSAISQYEKKIISAAYYENGMETKNTIEWEFSGADKDTYNIVIDKNDITIECLSASDVPLRIKAYYDNYYTITDIILEGY